MSGEFGLLTQNETGVVEYQSLVEELYQSYPELSPEYFTLTEKQWRFVLAFPKTFNPAQAAAEAGYSTSTMHYLEMQGDRLLSNPVIRFWIEQFVKQRALPADAVLARLAEIATGSIEDFITILPETGQVFFDLRKAEEKDKLKLIKKLRYIKSGPGKGGVEIELHDPLRALELIGKHLGMWEDTAIKINDYTITVVREGDK